MLKSNKSCRILSKRAREREREKFFFCKLKDSYSPSPIRSLFLHWPQKEHTEEE